MAMEHLLPCLKANRLEPYPGGIKREYLPNADNIDNITQLYDIIHTIASGGTFVALTDTPAALGTAGQIPAVNTAGDALEFVDAGGGTFVSLTDTPTALGTAGQGVIVNTAGDALEFADIGGNDATAPDLFLAAVVASTAQGLSAADYTNYLTLVDGDELVNRGGYHHSVGRERAAKSDNPSGRHLYDQVLNAIADNHSRRSAQLRRVGYYR